MNILGRLRKMYYMPHGDDRFLADWLKRMICRPVPKFPRMVQIQTHTGCNGGCLFCPYSEASRETPRGRMSDTLFKKIVKEIADHNVTQRISPYLMNEPFLDPEILEKARYIKKHVPKARIVLTTNGSLLTESVVEDLTRDNPLRAIYISMQGIDKEPYESVMGGTLVFERTFENVERLIAARDAKIPDLKIVITMVKTNRIDVDKAVDYWRSRGVEAKYTRLENRGGNTQAFDALNTGKKKQYTECVRLLKNAYILFNGDMVLCCTDYFKTTILGNVNESSIYDIWNSPHALGIRRNFLRRHFSSIPLCNECLMSA